MATQAQMEKDPETKLTIPSKGQLMWHEDEVGVFYHMNPTFPLDKMTFENFDPKKIIDAAESVNAKHIVVVCKHVNGFCWWPTKATKPGDKANTKNIALTKFKDGKGDVVAEIFAEARKRGIRPGVYLATRDDHYGAGEQGKVKNQKEYNDYYMTQATELATKYGDLAEWWVDGSSNPALGKRLKELLDKHQPNAVIFQSNYATLRWVGNEHGSAPYPIWNTISKKKWDDIHNSGRSVTAGDPDGVRWVPAEVDTTFTSGWFGGNPRSLDDLKKVFYHSVGNGVGLLINFPVRKDGSIAPDVLQRAKEFNDYIEKAVGHKLYSIKNQKGKEVMLTFDTPAEIDHVAVKEDLRFGERVRKFKVEAYTGDTWIPVIEEGVSLGYQLIRKIDPIVVTKVRITVEESVGEPRIKEIYVTRTGMKKPDKTPPSVPSLAKVKVDGRLVSIQWNKSEDTETGIKYYEVYRGREKLAETTQTEFVDSSANENSAYEYSVKAVNGFGLPSETVQIIAKTKADNAAPKLKAVTTLPGRKSVSVKFDEAVSINAARFSIEGYKILSAKLSGSKIEVVLSLEKRIPFGADLTVKVKGVKDTASKPNELKNDVTFPVLVDDYQLAYHWDMSKVQGNVLLDSRSDAKAKHATMVGTKVVTQNGNSVLELDGNSYAKSDSAGVQTNFTLSVAVKPESNNGTQIICSKETNGSAVYQFRLFSQNGNVVFHMSNEGGSDFGLWKFVSNKKLNAGTWNQIIIRNEDKNYKMYLNGELVAEKNTSDIIQQPYNFNAFIIGANKKGGDQYINHFKGAIDDVKIYQAALPEEELKLLTK